MAECRTFFVVLMGAVGALSALAAGVLSPPFTEMPHPLRDLRHLEQLSPMGHLALRVVCGALEGAALALSTIAFRTLLGRMFSFVAFGCLIAFLRCLADVEIVNHGLAIRSLGWTLTWGWPSVMLQTTYSVPANLLLVAASEMLARGMAGPVRLHSFIRGLGLFSACGLACGASVIGRFGSWTPSYVPWAALAASPLQFAIFHCGLWWWLRRGAPRPPADAPPLEKRDLWTEAHLRAMAVLLQTTALVAIVFVLTRNPEGWELIRWLSGLDHVPVGLEAPLVILVALCAGAVGFLLRLYSNEARLTALGLATIAFLSLIPKIYGTEYRGSAWAALATACFVWSAAVVWLLASARAAAVCSEAYRVVEGRSPDEAVPTPRSPFLWAPAACVLIAFVLVAAIRVAIG